MADLALVPDRAAAAAPAPAQQAVLVRQRPPSLRGGKPGRLRTDRPDAATRSSAGAWTALLEPAMRERLAHVWKAFAEAGRARRARSRSRAASRSRSRSPANLMPDRHLLVLAPIAAAAIARPETGLPDPVVRATCRAAAAGAPPLGARARGADAARRRCHRPSDREAAGALARDRTDARAQRQGKARSPNPRAGRRPGARARPDRLLVRHRHGRRPVWRPTRVGPSVTVADQRRAARGRAVRRPAAMTRMIGSPRARESIRPQPARGRAPTLERDSDLRLAAERKSLMAEVAGRDRRALAAELRRAAPRAG